MFIFLISGISYILLLTYYLKISFKNAPIANLCKHNQTYFTSVSYKLLYYIKYIYVNISFIFIDILCIVFSQLYVNIIVKTRLKIRLEVRKLQAPHNTHRYLHDDVRLKIDTAAIELINEVGMENLKIRDICERADISIGTFYNYYKNKNDLPVNKINDMGTYLKGAYEHLHGTSKERLSGLIYSYALGNVSSGLEYNKAVYDAILYSRTTPEMEKEREVYKLTKEIIENGQVEKVFRSDISSHDLAKMTIAYIRGINFDWVHTDGSYDLLEFSNKATEVWLDAISEK